MLYKDMIYTPFSGAVYRTSRTRAGLYVDLAWLYLIDAAEKLEMYHALF